MSEESRSAPRELQLETRHLAGLIVLIAILCVSSFMLGRWVERQALRAETASPAGAGAPPSIAVEDVNRELTYFRTLEGGNAPPSVDAAPAETRPSPVPVERRVDPEAAAAPWPEEAPEPGGYMVQVMATKDRAAAEGMRSRLTGKGYRVTIVEGDGPSDAGLRKVRVGPYTRRSEAERAAKRLEAEERVHTWIP